VVAGTTCEGSALASVRWVGVGSAATVVVGTTRECATLDPGPSVGVGPARQCGVGHNRSCSGLCSFGRRGINQPLWKRARRLRVLLWPMFALSAWTQKATVVAGKAVEGGDVASLRLFGVALNSHSLSGHYWLGRFCCLCLRGRRGLSQPMWWRARQVRTLLCPMFAWWALAHPATVVARTSGEGAALASVRSGGLGSASHCACGHDW
jgi:hypothetical protein